VKSIIPDNSLMNNNTTANSSSLLNNVGGIIQSSFGTIDPDNSLMNNNTTANSSSLLNNVGDMVQNTVKSIIPDNSLMNNNTLAFESNNPKQFVGSNSEANNTTIDNLGSIITTSTDDLTTDNRTNQTFLNDKLTGNSNSNSSIISDNRTRVSFNKYTKSNDSILPMNTESNDTKLNNAYNSASNLDMDNSANYISNKLGADTKQTSDVLMDKTIENDNIKAKNMSPTVVVAPTPSITMPVTNNGKSSTVAPMRVKPNDSALRRIFDSMLATSL
jgi:hypothetical protein